MANSNKKRIYICYTGGTIGMSSTEQGYVMASGSLVKQISGMAEFYRPGLPLFHIEECLPLTDSANITSVDWHKIANMIINNYMNYDGFIVLHGTDSMAYTASALSFMLEGLAKPVIITGSQIPLAELRTDAINNLLNSLYLAAYHPINQVTLFFSNSLFRGNRTSKILTDGFNAFDSPNFPALCKVGVKIQPLSDELLHTTYSLSCMHNAMKKYNQIITKIISPQPIGVIILYPSMAMDIISYFINQPVKALILMSYGAGNAPHQPKLFALLEQAIKKQIIVVNLSQCFKGQVDMACYATGSSLANVGVISGYDMTLEATLGKLHYLFSQPLSISKIKSLMVTDLRGELTKDH